MKNLSPKGLGIAAALLAGLCMVLLSLLGSLGYMESAVAAMQQWHNWYDLTAAGIILGIIEAMVTGYVGGYLFGVFYNKFAK